MDSINWISEQHQKRVVTNGKIYDGLPMLRSDFSGSAKSISVTATSMSADHARLGAKDVLTVRLARAMANHFVCEEIREIV